MAGPRLTRRAFLRASGLAGVAVFAPLGRGPSGGPVAVALDADGAGFLTPEELATLRAVVDRLVPGPPEDADPGALAAGCAEAIDALLAAFRVDPPRIYAGGPFSDRGGAPHNDFAEFVPLDPYEELAWRLRVEGSGGRPELERNGPVVGWQQRYRDGLAALDDAAPGGSFASLPSPTQELVLRTAQGDAAALVDLALVHTLELLYGAPEYGGNRDLVGWTSIGWDGDVQPRGYTDEEVEQPGRTPFVGALPGGLPVEQQRLAAFAALASPELSHGLMAAGDGGLDAHRRGIPQAVDGTAGLATLRRQLDGAVREVAATLGRDRHGR